MESTPGRGRRPMLKGRWSQNPLGDDSLISAEPGNEVLAQMLIPLPDTLRVLTAAHRGPISLGAMAAELKMPKIAVKLVLQPLIGAGLVTRHLQADGAGVAAAVMTGPPSPPVPGMVPTYAAKITVLGPSAVSEAEFISGAIGSKPIRTTVRIPVRSNEALTVDTYFGQTTFARGELSISLSASPVFLEIDWLWAEAFRGVLGAVVLLNPNEIDLARIACAQCEQQGVPYVIAVHATPPNEHEARGLREHLRREAEVGPDVPIELTETRNQQSVCGVLRSLAAHARSFR